MLVFSETESILLHSAHKSAIYSLSPSLTLIEDDILSFMSLICSPSLNVAYPRFLLSDITQHYNFALLSFLQLQHHETHPSTSLLYVPAFRQQKTYSHRRSMASAKARRAAFHLHRCKTLASSALPPYVFSHEH